MDRIEENETDRTKFEIVRSGKLPGSELVIGLVGAVGADLGGIAEKLAISLADYEYNSELIRISELIGHIVNVPSYNTQSEYERIDTLMSAGDKAREKTEDCGILALVASSEIYGSRKDKDGKPQTRPREAFIINSLKHPDEVDVLRRIYGNGFFLLGAYVDPDERYENLIHRKNMAPADAKQLMKRDESEGIKHGQRTRDTFQLSDFFIHLKDDEDSTRNAIDRILDLLFSNPYRTPLFDEYAMYMAFAAATRSADLSRQIGAVITQDNEVIATGVNECPKAQGGTYWPFIDGEGRVRDEEDGRDYMRGFDSNDREKGEIVRGTIERIEAVCQAEQERTGKQIPMLPEELLRRALSEGPIDDITEYGRVVHAEMNALLTCARNNISCRGGVLYTTTFPCHNCAKHIIAAGIKRVVYIEPYPKSKAIDFHSDAAFMGFYNEDDETGNKVAFEPFVGIGPRRFFDLFSMKQGSGFPLRRKDPVQGRVIEKAENQGVVRLPSLPWSYLEREELAFKILEPHLKGR